MKLRKNYLNLFPEFEIFITDGCPESVSTWEGPLSNGKALEVLTLFTLLSRIKKCGAEVKIEEKFYNFPSWFFLRNEIPRHHGAQAGHEFYNSGDISIKDRFEAALLPKAKIIQGTQKWMVYREGNPLKNIFDHFSGKPDIHIRPDICLVSGDIEIEFLSKKRIQVTHRDREFYAVSQILAKNSELIPLYDFTCSKDYHVSTIGIIECSVSKITSVADAQLKKYLDAYETNKNCQVLLVNGLATTSNFSTLTLDMKSFPFSLSEDFAVSKIDHFINGVLGVAQKSV